jgi:hypothetical protein
MIMDAAVAELSIAYMVSVPRGREPRMRLSHSSNLTRAEQHLSG